MLRPFAALVGLATAWALPAQAVEPADEFIVIMLGCQAEQVHPASCEQLLWDFADITGDGMLSAAELTRAGRMAMRAMEALEGKNSPANVLFAVLLGPTFADVLLGNFDYDGDGRLSLDEFHSDYTEGGGKALAEELIASAQELGQDFRIFDKFLDLMILSEEDERAVGELESEPEAAPDHVEWKMASSFSRELVVIGDQGERFASRLRLMSGGEISIEFFDPGTLVPALEIFDAVSRGTIDAGWSAAGYWAGKVPALQFFTAVPFGPGAEEALAWYRFGGGRELWRELLAPHNMVGFWCNAIPGEGGGWFRKPIKTVADLDGLKIRFFGLGAKVMERLGVSTQLVSGGDIFPALELGTIDATEFSMPAIDLDLGFYQVAKHYYLPGWHQPAAFGELLVNLDRWNELSDRQRTQIDSACGENIQHGLAYGASLQPEALREIRSKGVTLHRWPKEILAAMRKAWEEVVAEEAAADADFARVWESFSTFRKDYAIWREYNAID